jgi:dsRNA-specific ribonuclease
MAGLEYATWVLPNLPDDFEVTHLPQVVSSLRRRQIFTHKSLYAVRRGSSLDIAAGTKDYSKLEHLGDAILCKCQTSFRSNHSQTDSIVTSILQEHWPNLLPGPATVC